MKYTEMGLADLQVLEQLLLVQHSEMDENDPDVVKVWNKIIKVNTRMEFLASRAFED